MTDSNINPPSTIPGTEVTTSPGLIPETPTEYIPGTANVDTAVPPNTSGVGGHEADIAIGDQDYAAAVDHMVNDMPTYTETEIAHQDLMNDPKYAIATHEHTLNKYADLLEQIVGRLNAIEEKLDAHITDVTGPDPNDPLAAYPEVKQHQNR